MDIRSIAFVANVVAKVVPGVAGVGHSHILDQIQAQMLNFPFV